MIPIPILKLISLRAATAGLMLAVLATGLAPSVPANPAPVRVRAAEATRTVDRSSDFSLPRGTSHVAVHWRGQPNARVEIAFSRDGTSFGAREPVLLDEVGAARHDGETYGAVVDAQNAVAVRVTTDRRLYSLTVVTMDAGAEVGLPVEAGPRATAQTAVPAIIPRSGWSADESIRFDPLGEERWGHAYFPLQKLIVHHTAGGNNDPNPAATVRAIYHYHAVSQDWGDIGYQYLVDAAGRIYEGRQSRDYWNGATPTADDGTGLVVEGGHTFGHNPGTMGVALLGNFTSVYPTVAARNSLVRLLAWAAASHGIDPRVASTYVNPVTGRTRNTPNVGAHREYVSTGCPGGALYSLMPSIRGSVGAAMNLWPAEVYNPVRVLSFAAGTYVGRKFNTVGAITASKSAIVTGVSAAPTSQRATVPNQGGNWFLITAGTLAGYWVQESAGTTLAAPPPAIPVEAYSPYRTVSFQAGTYVGRKFNSSGAIIGSRVATVASTSSAPTTQKSAIPNQAGNWYFITAGTLSGYWVQESAGMSLGTPPPEWPEPTEVYQPQRTLVFAAGTYIGRRFNAYGAITTSKSATVTGTSSAPTDRKSPIPNQTGLWYFITAGGLEGYWVQESAGTTLAP